MKKDSLHSFLSAALAHAGPIPDSALQADVESLVGGVDLVTIAADVAAERADFWLSQAASSEVEERARAGVAMLVVLAFAQACHPVCLLHPSLKPLADMTMKPGGNPLDAPILLRGLEEYLKFPAGPCAGNAQVARHVESLRANIASALDRLIGAAVSEALQRQLKKPVHSDRIALAEMDRLLEDRPIRRVSAGTIRFVHADRVQLKVHGARDLGRSPEPVPAPALRSAAPALELTHSRERVAQLESEVGQLRHLLEVERARRDAVGQSSDAEGVMRSLRARISHLERGILLNTSDLPGAKAGDDPLPDSWDALELFADRILAGSVVLSSKAVRTAKRSYFANIPYAYDVLRMLARSYVPMRNGLSGARERFEAECARLKVSVEPTGRAADERRSAGSYSVLHLGVRRALDLHVRGSSSRDPREGFRLYFAWVDDPAGGYVVVGSFPGHLENGQS
ncbi:hypothetical protein E4T66_18205 [Sinimarinibacterium sp. CAU 1509]|uniref:hypothetical protein n=1 Tax=Sinimarinibacterium sp. CAU 1509 TaxID=2562283 RepID=UPI0010AC0EDC|nr:hypothetical protein [Sinimarinibacterium sp. CAU 1509]TJY57339.1 hypothetical protein E4T66_18205 [Sinimarinibacterium sp. CAU 1509]